MYQEHKGSVALRGDIVKDDSSSCAVFTEQGFSASQMTAAKVVLVIARLPDSAGQAADAVSAYIHVKMEGAPKLLIIPKSHVCHDTNGPNHCQILQIQWFFVRTPALQASCGKDSLRKSIGSRMGKSTEMGMSLRSSKVRIVLFGFRG